MITEAKVITIDGSSASGKGTLAKNIAEKLNWGILDSGAIYRVIALVAERYDLVNHERPLIRKLRNIEIQFLNQGCLFRVPLLLNVLPLLLQEILDRDARDSERSAAPLRPADDSILIDSSQLSASEVAEVAFGTLEEKGIYRKESF